MLEIVFSANQTETYTLTPIKLPPTIFTRNVTLSAIVAMTTHICLCVCASNESHVSVKENKKRGTEVTKVLC